MIKNKYDLKSYLIEDKKALSIKRRIPPIVGHEIWKFQISLRYLEYYTNVGSKGLRWLIWKIINHHYGIKLGFDIPINTFGKGLNIHHYGCIVVHPNARIGDHCNIQQCVNIGQNYSPDNVPNLGNNIYLGPGVKIFGKVVIADGCAIGAGAVVTKSFLEPNKTIVGNPGKVIGNRKEGLV